MQIAGRRSNGRPFRSATIGNVGTRIVPYTTVVYQHGIKCVLEIGACAFAAVCVI